MNYKKILFVTAIMVILGLTLSLNIPITKAMTMAEIQTMIAQFQTQIAQLQQQLKTMQSQPVAWCHNFNYNLQIGNTGQEVGELQSALQKEGFLDGVTNEFNEETASAVVGFQEKYKDEVLTPWKLRRGTGFVGKGTRAKLNQIYGCVSTSASFPTPATNIAPVPTATPTPAACIQITTLALNPSTNECRVFSTPCDVPASWKKVSNCSDATSVQTPVVAQPVTTSIITETGTGIHRFQLINSSACPPCVVGTVCKTCSLESGIIRNAKVSVYSDKGSYIDTKDTSSGQAVFENLPYGNYTVVFNAESYETDKSMFTVGANYGTDSAVFLKKTLTASSSSSFSAQTVSSSVTVLYPNGGEIWEAGKTYTIKWSSSGMSSAESINIQLSYVNTDTGSRLEDVILKSTIPNTGVYNWTIPLSVISGRIADQFSVRVIVPNRNIWDYSDASFSIVAPVSSGGSTSSAGSSTSVAVAPAYSCANLNVKQQPYFDKCRKEGFDNVCFNKYSAEFQGCNRNSWNDCTVQNVNAASNLLCALNATTIQPETSVSSVSTTATPVSSAPSIAVLYPNGGEKWQRGSTYNIKWNVANSAVDNVYIKLRKGSDTYPGIEGVVSGTIPNIGFFQWTIPTTLPEGNDYAIRVIDAATLNLDDSNALFSIVAGTTGLNNADNQLANISSALAKILEKTKELLSN